MPKANPISMPQALANVMGKGRVSKVRVNIMSCRCSEH